MLIGLEGAHALYVGIFGGDEHLRHFRAGHRDHAGRRLGGRIQKGAQGRDRTTDTRIFSEASAADDTSKLATSRTLKNLQVESHPLRSRSLVYNVLPTISDFAPQIAP